MCPDFVEDICKKLSIPPYVCNGCFDEHVCVLRKKYYFHNPAHQNYRKILVETREGVNISEDELIQLDEFISPLILKGQSVHHIVANNKDEFSVSEKSLYRYVADGLLKARNIDMPRVCRLKPRSSKPLYKDGPIDEQVKKLTKGKGVDKIIIAGGDVDTFNEAVKSVKPGGIISNVNYLGSGDFIKIPREEWIVGMGHIRIVGGLMPAGRMHRELHTFIYCTKKQNI